MIKAVVDTNIFISGIFWPGGVPWRVLCLLRDGRIDVLFSPPLYQELRKKCKEIAKKHNVDMKVYTAWREVIARYAQWIYALPEVSICRDPKDNMVLATAIAGRSDYIVTSDLDLLSLKNYHDISIIRAQKFLERIV